MKTFGLRGTLLLVPNHENFMKPDESDVFLKGIGECFICGAEAFYEITEQMRRND